VCQPAGVVFADSGKRGKGRLHFDGIVKRHAGAADSVSSRAAASHDLAGSQHAGNRHGQRDIVAVDEQRIDDGFVGLGHIRASRRKH
jgi:uncharacterized protein (DUF2252 family)